MVVSLVLFALLINCSRKTPTALLGDKTVIQGIVADSLSGQPLSHTTVSIQSNGMSTVTDSTGRYRFVGMGGGSFSLNFDRPDYHLNNGAVTVAANDSQVLNIKLYPCQWQIVYINLPEPWGTNSRRIRDLYFINENEGWAVCYYEGYGIDEGYGAILDFVDNTHGWACGHGPIKYTINGGASWNTYTAFSSPLCIDFINTNMGWYAGSIDAYKSMDGGVTWDYQSDLPGMISNDMPLKILFVTQSIGWIHTRTNLYKTIDGGQTWSLIFNNLPDAATIWHMPGAALEALPQGQVWVEGKYSTNYGNTWVNQPCDTNVSYFSASFIDQYYGWMSGTGHDGVSHYLYHTLDGGTTWSRTTISGTVEINALQFINRRRGWAASLGRKILIYK
jgi:hypothetical protein